MGFFIFAKKIMQQLALFDFKEKEINKWKINLKITNLDNGYYLGVLLIPSWKFILKYTFEHWKIITFEVLDYSGYLYLTVSLIKNIKKLLEVMLAESK